MKSRFATSGLLVALVGVVSVLPLGLRELWNPMEPRYAGIALEMLRSGDYLVPRYEGLLYDQKPPLAFWVSAAGMAWLGEDSRSALRLPSALGALLAVLGAASLARRLYGRRVGCDAGIVVATSYLTVWSAGFMHLDTLLAAGMVWAVRGVIEALARGGSRKVAIASMAMGSALGFMTKGPLVTLVVLALLVASARAPHARRAACLAGCSTLLAGLAFLAWYLPARSVAGAAWGDALVFGQGLSRAIEQSSEGDRHGPFYYFRAILGALAPWSLFLPLVPLVLKGSTGLRRRSALLGVALLVLFVLLSAHGMRRERYLAPLLPLVAPWIALALCRMDLPQGWLLWRARISSGLARLTFGLIVLLAVWPGLLSSVAGSHPRTVAALAALAEPILLRTLAGTLAAGMLLAAWRSTIPPRRALQGAAALAFALYGLWVVPSIDAGRNDRALIDLIQCERGAEPLVLLGPYAVRESTFGWFYWYTGVPPIQVPEWPADLMELQRARPTLVILPASHESQQALTWPKGTERLSQAPMGRAELHVLRLPAREVGGG